MISSIFGKTKPVNFVILLSFIFFFYPVVNVFVLNREIADLNLLKEIIAISVLLFSIFIMDFIVKRNKLTKNNSYAILFFTLLVIAFPDTLGDSNAIFSTFFLLLAIRRILSIKSLKNIRLKIFDASLWILVGSLFYDWAIIYMVLVLSAIYIYEPKNIRNWFIILSATVCFVLILIGFLSIFDRIDWLLEHYRFNLDLKNLFVFDMVSNVKIGVYFLINVILIIWAFLKLGKGGVGRIIMIRLVVLSFALGMLMNILVLSSESHALIITFFPSVILMTNYIQSIKREKFREILLMVSILIPVSIFLGRLLVS
ncbi:DUF6427 family protein [Maribacter litopenaei]|uniref:DUF6427 family protein n=2 Tax=Maribacter litopenaei TaxID=2976127 RepID=A0ABY5Y828_9FLAO|nr:DUF6427 family protein [Maribacter litopenaei]UWX55011.1 DUF6427 family protein [Maribacter litopenaei]